MAVIDYRPLEKKPERPVHVSTFPTAGCGWTIACLGVVGVGVLIGGCLLISNALDDRQVPLGDPAVASAQALEHFGRGSYHLSNANAIAWQDSFHGDRSDRYTFQLPAEEIGRLLEAMRDDAALTETVGFQLHVGGANLPNWWTPKVASDWTSFRNGRGWSISISEATRWVYILYFSP
jgi:hypothetical protein